MTLTLFCLAHILHLMLLHYLFDHVIMQFAEHQMLLDFEGSEIPGIARFFKSFGSGKTHYFRLKINKLPWLLRWLK